MKKIINLLFIAFFALNLSAQIPKGKFFVASGSDITLSYGKGELKYEVIGLRETKTNKISLELSPGIFIIDNMVFGLSMLVEYEKSEFDDFNQELKSFGLAPYIRYYISNTKIKPYFNFDGGYLFAHNKSNLYEHINDTYNGFVIDFGIGISVFFTEKIAFDTQIAYGYSTMINSEDSKIKLITNGIGIMLGFDLIF